MSKTEVQIVDLLKPDSYTGRGRYVVVINGQRLASGNTETKALLRTLVFVYDSKESFKDKFYEVVKACAPIVNLIRPIEGEEG